jgi:hypothetical protein
MNFQGRNEHALDNTCDFIGFMGFGFRDLGGRQYDSSIARRGARHLRHSNAYGSPQYLKVRIKKEEHKLR